MHSLSSLWFRLTLLFLLSLLLFLGLASWRQSSTTKLAKSLLEPLPQDPLIQVYFNQAQSASYSDPYRQQERFGDNLEQVVIEAITSAQSSIEVAVHEINLPNIAKALAAKQQSGVRVRVIVENTYSRPMSSLTLQEAASLEGRQRHKYQEFLQLVDQNQDGTLSSDEVLQRDAIVILKNAAIPILDDTADGSKGSGLMHHKFMTIDGNILVVGSANLTMSDVHGDFLSPASQGNANHLLKITSSELVSYFTEEFNFMWGGGEGGKSNSQFGVKKPYRSAHTVALTPKSTFSVQFSPISSRLSWQKSANGLIGKTLIHAARTIDLALFVFSDQHLADILEGIHSKGISIRTLIEPQFAYRDYSELLDLLGIAVANDRCRYEPSNRPWTRAITTAGIPILPAGDLLHHKMAVIDSHTVITGSQNWSNAANYNNDENVLIINNSTVAAHFQREFERLYQSAKLGVPDSLRHKIQKQQSQC